MTRDEYIELLKLDKKMAAIERQVRRSRRKLKVKIDSYVPEEQQKLVREA